MAVSLPADIVMDVARAASPAKFQAAVNKLGGSDYAAVAQDVALAFAGDDAGGGPVDEGAGLARAGQRHFDVELARLRLGGRDGFTSVTGSSRQGSAYEQFEAVTLQKFVESMLPKQSAALYGSGFAGETWKSFLAQQVAVELARSGGIGIARMVERAHPGEKTNAAASGMVSGGSASVDAA